MNRLDAVVRNMQIVYLAMVVSSLTYPLLGEMLVRRGFAREIVAGPVRVSGTDHFQLGMAFVALAIMAVVVLLRSRMLPEATDTLQQDPENLVAIQRWNAANFLTFPLCEAIGVFGLLARVLGAPLGRALLFYAASLALLLIYRPSRP